jgi:coatomer subunit beta
VFVFFSLAPCYKLTGYTSALLLGGDFFTGAVLAAALTKLVLRLSDLSPDKKMVNALRAEAMLIMTSTIRVGQSKFTSAPIDEDSSERILNCIQTLSELEVKPVVHDIFLSDTKAAYSKMVAAQEVYFSSAIHLVADY